MFSKGKVTTKLCKLNRE